MRRYSRVLTESERSTALSQDETQLTEWNLPVRRPAFPAEGTACPKTLKQESLVHSRGWKVRGLEQTGLGSAL